MEQISGDTIECPKDNLSVIPEEEADSSTTVKENAGCQTAVPESATIQAPETLPQSKMLKISREEMEKIKRRLTIDPRKPATFVTMSSIDSFCRKSQEALKMGSDEAFAGLLGAPNQLEEERRKSAGGVFPTSQSLPTVSPGISWRDELKALKQELALPASVSLRISGMEKTCHSSSENSITDKNGSSKPEAPQSDGSEKDEGPTFNIVVNPSSPPPALLKDIDLDFLSTLGSGLINHDLARQSVFLHFDPVVEKALKDPNPAEVEREPDTLGVSEEERIQRISAVQKQISNNRERDLKELDDLIEKLISEIEEQENRSQMPEVLSTSEQTELLMNLDREIPRLQAELIEQPVEIQQLLDEIDECDQLIVQLTEDMKKFEASKEKLLEEKLQDNNSHKEHLEYMEEMFDTVYQNYQKAKASRKGLLHNKMVLEKHNQHLSEVENQFKENLAKIKAEHEQIIMKAKRELASKEAEIREIKKQQELQGVPQTFC